MLNALDRLLNRITMYRLVFYVLIGLLSFAAGFGFFGALPYSGWQIIGTSLFLTAACWLVNRIFAWGFNAPPHDDSAFITALILALIITPYRRQTDLPILIWAPILAMAAKYIVAWRRQHFFNPAALAVVVTSLAIQKSASWWVGTMVMFWPVLIGSFLIVRKIRRFDAVTSYLLIATVSVFAFSLLRGSSVIVISRQLFLNSPLIFFASVMLTEPATMPPTHRWRIAYGGLIGLLSAPFVHVSSFYFTPELALVTGNALGWFVARRQRFILTLRERLDIAPSISDFIFDIDRRPRFQAGQYLEWGLAHTHPDGRGVRRFFTIASSPTEDTIRLGIKKYEPMSSYKRALLALQPGQTIVAHGLDGDFTLPENTAQPLVFIAGGIGITPFRSMLNYLLDRRQARSMTLLYANQRVDDIVYQDVINRAVTDLGLKAVYILSDQEKIPPDWTGRRGYMTAEMIQQEVPDYAAARFYLSGPQGMVTAYKQILRSLGIRGRNIVTDYFPGFA